MVSSSRSPPRARCGGWPAGRGCCLLTSKTKSNWPGRLPPLLQASTFWLAQTPRPPAAPRPPASLPRPRRPWTPSRARCAPPARRASSGGRLPVGGLPWRRSVGRGGERRCGRRALFVGLWRRGPLPQEGVVAADAAVLVGRWAGEEVADCCCCSSCCCRMARSGSTSSKGQKVVLSSDRVRVSRRRRLHRRDRRGRGLPLGLLRLSDRRGNGSGDAALFLPDQVLVGALRRRRVGGVRVLIKRSSLSRLSLLLLLLQERRDRPLDLGALRAGEGGQGRGAVFGRQGDGRGGPLQDVGGRRGRRRRRGSVVVVVKAAAVEVE